MGVVLALGIRFCGTFGKTAFLLKLFHQSEDRKFSLYKKIETTKLSENKLISIASLESFLLFERKLQCIILMVFFFRSVSFLITP
jgi:hypothetical protein